MHELPNQGIAPSADHLARPRDLGGVIPESPTHPTHALVIGGGIAGLVTARVLSDHFDIVTVVERDQFPTEPVPRPGVPQGHHLHVLLMRGQQILEQLFPGLQAELAAAGAPEMDWLGDVVWFTMDRWAPRFSSRMQTNFSSRNLLEWSIRRRLAQNPRVHLLGGRRVTGLITDDRRSRVTGISFAFSFAPSQEQELSADLIVDASGRESKLSAWLEAIGYPRPPENVVNSFLGYASRIYQPPPDFHADWKGILLTATPPESTRGAVIFPIEGGRWIANLGAGNHDYPPTDEQGFLEFAGSLPVSAIYDALRQAKPLTPIYGYRRTENRWRRYDRLSRWPENLVALGDAVCAFNPVYGQGMTVAALGALSLGEIIRTEHRRKPDGDLTGLARRFQSRLAKVNETPWSMATGVDFVYPDTEGERPGSLNRVLNGYMYQVRMLTFDRPEVHRLFFEVVHLVKPPSVLLSPRIARQVLGRIVHEEFRPSNPPPSRRSYAKSNSEL